MTTLYSMSILMCFAALIFAVFKQILMLTAVALAILSTCTLLLINENNQQDGAAGEASPNAPTPLTLLLSSLPAEKGAGVLHKECE